MFLSNVYVWFAEDHFENHWSVSILTPFVTELTSLYKDEYFNLSTAHWVDECDFSQDRFIFSYCKPREIFHNWMQKEVYYQYSKQNIFLTLIMGTIDNQVCFLDILKLSKHLKIKRWFEDFTTRFL